MRRDAGRLPLPASDLIDRSELDASFYVCGGKSMYEPMLAAAAAVRVEVVVPGGVLSVVLSQMSILFSDSESNLFSSGAARDGRPSAVCRGPGVGGERSTARIPRPGAPAGSCIGGSS